MQAETEKSKSNNSGDKSLLEHTRDGLRQEVEGLKQQLQGKKQQLRGVERELGCEKDWGN